jgi:hypothetical protein
MKILLRVLLSVLLVLPGVVPAAKLYKWVDKDGKVTYQETPPPAGAAKVEEKNIDPDMNVIKSEQPIPSASPTRPPPNIGEEATGTEGAPPKHRPHAGIVLEGDQPTQPEATPLPAREPPLPPPLPPLPQPPISPPPPPMPPPGGAR